MYADQVPCAVCGSAVRLRPHEPACDVPDEPVGPADGVVGTADPTVDDRVCSNPDCPTRTDPDSHP